MKILLLGEKSNLLADKLISAGHNIQIICDKISLDMVQNYDFIISFSYRHIIKKDIIDKFINKIINLHISLLPYNRGADPNLWSYLENTPKGVTIHYIDGGLDTGDIIVQKEVQDNVETDTLKTSYDRLINEIVMLFNDNIEDIMFIGNIISVSYKYLSNAVNIKSMGKGFYTYLTILSAVLSGSKIIIISMSIPIISSLLELILKILP